jgi:TRAP-type C4-dicarboxylate transport system permease small subunit
MRAVERIAHAVLFGVQLLGGTLLFASAVLIVVNAIGRYVFAAPILWGEEVLRFGLLWMVFLGAVLVSWDDRHLRMDLISATLKGRPLVIVRGLAVLVLLGVALVIAYHSLTPVSLYARTGQVSQIAEIPMVIPHTIIPVSMVLIVLAIVVRIRGHLRGSFDGEETGGGEDAAATPGEPTPHNDR